MKQLIIYGAGNTGRATARLLGSPMVFIDRRAQGEIDGVRIVNPEELHLCCRKNPVLIAVFSPQPECATQKIIEYLTSLGYNNFIDFEQFYQLRHKSFKRTFFWLAPIDFFRAKMRKIESARLLFAHDPESAELFELQIRHRLGESWRILPEPRKINEQYFDNSVPLNLPNKFSFADIGAFNGDTLRTLPKNAGEIWALEPDAGNFAALNDFLRSSTLQAKAIKKGAGSKNTILNFMATDGESSHITKSGTEQIEVIKLDDLFDAPPDYVKMDIEGAEKDAIKGMKKTIRHSAPRLAISVYHSPEDIFAIPLLLKSWQPKYSFFLRCYGSHAMETVLYAVNLRDVT